MKGLDAIIGASPAIGAIRSLVQTIARSASTVLILGESGTGKELVARALHDLSDRRDAHFVPVNCAAIPKELIESELFGHRKGAFTGALADRVGRFELAHGGSLFLDEIGDLALDMQVKLLRVLQERAIDPIGASRPVPIDIRIIAATHRDIEGEIASGHFRQDLFYRLNVLPIEMPPLRSRIEDVPALMAHFARRMAQPGAVPIRIAEDLMHLFQCYEWPGNVRELANLVDRLSVLFPGSKLSVSNVPESMLPRGLRPYAQQMSRMSDPEKSADAYGTEADLFAEPTGAPQVQPATELAVTAVSLGPSQSFGLAVPPAEGFSVTSEGVIPAGVRSVEEIVMMVEDETPTAAPADDLAMLPDDGLHLKEHLAEIEKTLILQAIARAGGNISQTARLLRLQRTTLIEKINKYSLRLP